MSTTFSLLVALAIFLVGVVVGGAVMFIIAVDTSVEGGLL